MKRWEIIQTLIDLYDLRTYLEIGVFKGECFDKIEAEVKHSVDPEFPAIFKMTSDEFFEDNRYHKKIDDPELTYDIIFIDGLHTAYQVYKDICNSLKILNPGGFIVVHDCNPATKWHARPPEEYKRGEEWNGTTYLGFIQFKEQNPDISCFTVDTDYGCGIITSLPLVKNTTWGAYMSPSFEYFERNREQLLGLISVEQFRGLGRD